LGEATDWTRRAPVSPGGWPRLPRLRIFIGTIEGSVNPGLYGV